MLGKDLHLTKIRAEDSGGDKCQCHYVGHDSFLQKWPGSRAPHSSQPLFTALGWLLIARESTALAALAVTGTNESAGRRRKEIAHQWNEVRWGWERGSMLRLWGSDCSSWREGACFDMVDCTRKTGAVLTSYLLNKLAK